ncbi:MAG: hypothetical protein U0175_14785 [Caldilineaceae bacterium]
MLLLLLALIPWFSRPGRVGVWFDPHRWPAQATVVMIAASLLILTWVALSR